MFSFKTLLYILHTITYFGTCFYYLCKDLDNSRCEFQWNDKKLQKYDDRIWEVWHNSLRDSIKNNIITYICILMMPIYKYEYNYSLLIINDVLKIPLYILVADLWFYTTHRICHMVPYLYKKVHKHHHSTNLVVSASGLDANLFEHIFINLGTIFVPYYLIGGSMMLLLLYIIYGSYSVTSSHAGYKNSKLHNTHHQLLNVNYGTGLYIFDRLFKTLKE